MNSTITLSVGKSIEISVDFSKFSEEVTNHLILIGAKNVLRDVHAGVDNGEAKERVERKLEALYRGELTTRQPGQTAALQASIAAKDAELAAKDAELAALREQLASKGKKR